MQRLLFLERKKERLQILFPSRQCLVLIALKVQGFGGSEPGTCVIEVCSRRMMSRQREAEVDKAASWGRAVVRVCDIVRIMLHSTHNSQDNTTKMSPQLGIPTPGWSPQVRVPPSSAGDINMAAHSISSQQSSTSYL